MKKNKGRLDRLEKKLLPEQDFETVSFKDGVYRYKGEVIAKEDIEKIDGKVVLVIVEYTHGAGAYHGKNGRERAIP